MKKAPVFFNLLVWSVLTLSIAFGDTPPPSSMKLKGGTDGTAIGNVADSLKVNVTNPGGVAQTVDQGKPAPTASAWPVAVQILPPVTVTSGSIAVSNFPTPVATQPVSVTNFPTPVATQSVLITNGTPIPVSGSFSVPANVNLNDATGNPIGSTSGALKTVQQGPIQISDGTHLLLINTDGTMKVKNLSSSTDSVSCSVSNFPSSQSVAVSNQISGYALEAGHLASIDAKVPALGANTIANSVPVNIASNQTVPVSVTNTPAVTVSNFPANQTVTISGTPSVSVTNQPSNYALETGGKLDSLNTKVKTGSQTTTNSIAVALASDQVAIPVTIMGTSTNPSVGTNGAAIPTSSTLVGGKDPSGNLQALSLATGGALKTDASATTQPVSVIGTPTVSVSNFPSSQPINGSVSVSNFPATQPISAASLPLPTNAAQETGGNLASLNTKVPSQGQALAAASLPVVLPVAQITALTPPTTVAVTQTIGTNLHTTVDNFPASQAVTGTFFQATQPVSVASLPLPAGASTAAKQPALGVAGTPSSDVITVQGIASMTPLKVDASGTTQPVSGTVAVSNFPASQAVTGTFFQSVQPVSQSGTWTTGRTWSLLNTTDSVNAVQSGAWSVTANAGTNLNTSALALETGGNLASINTKIPALGQALASASVPVVLTSAQLSTLTPLTAVTVTQGTGTNLHTVTDTGSTTSVSNFPAIQPVSQSGSWTVTANAGTNLNTSALALEGGGHLASLDTKLPAQGQALAAASTPVVLPAAQITTLTPPTTVTVTQATGTNLHTVVDSSALPSGGSTSANQSTEISSLSTIATNTTGVSTAANQTTMITSLGTIDTDIKASQPRKMQDGAGNALTSQVNGSQRALDVGVNVAGVQVDPRAIRALTASDVVTANQGGTWTTGRTWTLASGTDSTSAVQSGTWNLNNISGTISLPTGAATSALQTTGNTSLASLDAKTPALGQTSSLTAATPVVLPGDATPASQNITVVDSVSTSAVQAFNQTIWTGTPTAGSAATFTSSSFQTAILVVKGTWTGSVQVETSQDGGTSWIPHTVHVIGGSLFQSAFTANVQGSLNLSAKQAVRVRAVTAITGTATVSITETMSLTDIYVANSLRLADGANSTVSTPMTIMPVSTAAASTNTAVVVTERPDNIGTPTQTSVSCAATSTTLLAASTATQFLSIRNPTTSTNTVWLNLAGVAAVAAPPSIDIPPGGEADFFAESAAFLPTAQINCISGGSAQSVTVTYK